jgi:hypothetical protein
MKTETSTPFRSIDAAQLDAVVGGCACGCGQANCNCTNGSCGQGATRPGAATIPGAATFPGNPAVQRPLWGR